MNTDSETEEKAEEWKEAKISVKGRHAIHMRPMQQVVAEVKKFDSEVLLFVGEESNNAKSILDMIIFAVSLKNAAGDEILAKAKGDDAEEALAALAGIFEKALTEE